MSTIEYKSGSIEEAVANGYLFLVNNPAAAQMQAAAILKALPNHRPSMRLLAKALRRMDREADGEMVELDMVRLSLADPTIINAQRAARERRMADVEKLLVPYLDSNPHDAAALLILGETLGNGGAFRRGEELLQMAIASAPAYLDAQIALANLYHIQGRGHEGLPMVDLVLKRQPGNLSTLRFKATLLSESGRHAEAQEIYEGLLAAHADIIALWISYGDTLRTLGQRERAHSAYSSGLAIDRTFGRSWWGIADLGVHRFTHDDIADMNAALETRPGAEGNDNRYYLHFALGVAYAQHGDYAASFRHYDAGNTVRQGAIAYTPDIVTAEAERTEHILHTGFFTDRSDFGSEETGPIFVLGMPRSGSTLVEQILSSHPLIEGTAELPIIPILIQTMMADKNRPFGYSYRETLAELTAAECREIGAEYMRRAAAHRRTDRPFFVDKLPHNWADIGFIHMILPNARIVDVRRAPMDCCFSNFKLLFARGHPSSNDQVHIAAYYRDYVRMMRHFDVVLPGRVHRVIYEQLVDDLEGEARRLLNYIGVPFDPACLNFHETRRSVATASSEQVRQPLNRKGIDSWKNYEPWLGPMRETLGSLVDDYAR